MTTERRFSRQLDLPRGSVIVAGPVPGPEIASYSMHPGLTAFRPPDRQKEALVMISELPEGRVMLARHEREIVGYVTYHPPEPFERWGRDGIPGILELGAIEVAADWRHGGIARNLLEVSFLDEAMEDYVVFSTEYYWHWDLEQTGVSLWQYRRIMERVMGSVGMRILPTDEPEIASSPVNMLMARYGGRVDRARIERFEALLFEAPQPQES